MSTRKPRPDATKLDDIVAEAQRNRAKREQGYRDKALKMYPWVCGRCGREFTSTTVHELTVHHRDHNHDNNPPDGSNWELLCLYCHDNEHSRLLDGGSEGTTPTDSPGAVATHRPFAELEELLRRKK
ncbi:MAG: HNH nuclease family protein [Gammaproteobacteria bacterium]|nr:HNH nuclease family protein [Gammaproteobacteria bacterium]NIR85441.1 HNH nuclease family protein [Gammaproteobacteria bacterium]NIR89432.1 HNH nuclease family protein [Gammaproteobacteria bacterium]NIU06577.1 HNH nuclease family protein [Gammaproteobacteria bacterium]NIV53460.1 HNH nuclease family protein [Gammaproteobacteria bacterium]